jgi:parvulin-like peptidyl-prolyl isomerase
MLQSRFLKSALLLTISLLGAAVSSPAAPATGGKVAVEVNGDKIYVADVDRVLAMIKEREPALQTNSAAAQKSLADMRTSITDNFVVQRLLLQEAARQKITVKADAVDKGYKTYKADYGSDAAFNKAIAAEGKTPADVKKTIQEELVLRELTTRMTADVRVTDADLQAYYEANTHEFKVPEMVRAFQILIAYPENATPEQKQVARTKAEGLLKRAQDKKTDFLQLARENSDDAGTKDLGGDMDFIQRGWFLKAFEDAVFKAPVGLMPKLVETEIGLHIVRIDQKEPERLLTFEEIKDIAELRHNIRQDKVKKRIDDKIEALRKNAKITRY